MEKRKIVIFHKVNPDGTYGYIGNGLRRIGKDDYDIVRYKDLVVRLEGQDVQAYIASRSSGVSGVYDGELRPLTADLVYIRGFNQADIRQFIGHYCHDKNIKFLNTENKLTSPTSKLNQYYLFAKHGIPYPDTTIAYPFMLKHVIQQFHATWPVIIKSIHGKQGQSNFLVKDAEHLERVVASLDDKQAYAVQPFIENDGDYRLITCDGEVLACYKRSRQSGDEEHRNNVSQGSTRALIQPIPDALATIAQKVAVALNRELTGTDVLLDKDSKPYVLESNFNFGLGNDVNGLGEYVLQRLATKFHEIASER